MDRTVTTIIDEQLCNGCGRCVTVCPSGTITMEGKKAVVTGTESLNCGHCMAVCPTGAVQVTSLDPAQSTFKTFEAESQWLPFGKGQYPGTGQPHAIQAFSARNYQSKAVSRVLLEDPGENGDFSPFRNQLATVDLYHSPRSPGLF